MRLYGFYAVLFFAVLISTSPARADERCSDAGVFMVSGAYGSLRDCNIRVSLQPLKELERELENDRRPRKTMVLNVTRAMSRVYGLYRTDLPFDSSSKDSLCVQNEIKRFDLLRMAVLDSLVCYAGE